MKYNIGDKVKVRSDLNAGHGASADMVSRWAGNVVTIEKVEPVYPFFGKMYGSYNIVEDDCRAEVKYLWSDGMFEGLADEEAPTKTPTKTSKPMPKLVTGMFGMEHDGEKFVVAGERVVYQQSGKCEEVAYIEDHPELIKALYDAICFLQIDDGDAEVIWENTNNEETEEAEESKVTEVTKETKDTIGFAEFIATLEKLFGDAK